jgi:hypothetical protein
MATSCFLTSAVVVTPAPRALARIDARVIAVSDSVATRHGLKRVKPWPYCTVQRAPGTPEAAWKRGSLTVTACVELTDATFGRALASRVEIQIRRDGYWWNARSKIIRRELPPALRARFSGDSVTVTVDSS